MNIVRQRNAGGPSGIGLSASSDGNKPRSTGDAAGKSGRGGRSLVGLRAAVVSLLLCGICAWLLVLPSPEGGIDVDVDVGDDIDEDETDGVASRDNIIVPAAAAAAVEVEAAPAPLSSRGTPDTDTDADADADVVVDADADADIDSGVADHHAVVESLLRLARDMMPTTATSARARRLQLEEGEPFDLPALRRGECPWAETSVRRPDWLPARPPEGPAERFRNRNNNRRNGNNVVALYYEHLSKAGGTSFCKLAKANMSRKEVPRYVCMPSDPSKGLRDGRVGTWPARRIRDYVTVTESDHRIVSNEWSAFNPELLDAFQQQQGRSGDESKDEGGSGSPPTDPSVRLLFVTSIRHPIDRLLSAHKFFGPKKEDEGKKNDVRVPKFSLGTWIQNLARRSGGFRSDVGRFNFATWKFSGGTIGRTWEDRAEGVLLADGTVGEADIVAGEAAKLVEAEAQLAIDLAGGGDGGEREHQHQQQDGGGYYDWVGPFRTAVGALCRFDIVIPTELLSDHTGPLREVLGWNDFEASHVVSQGRVVNNDALTELSAEQFDLLWEANWLDMVLHAWASAVYLERVNCPVDALEETENLS